MRTFLVALMALASQATPLFKKARLPRRLIALEEHVILPALGDNISYDNSISSASPNARAQGRDLGAGRLQAMDKGHISLGVLSQLPGIGTSNLRGCQEANNELAQAIAAHPNRYAGFAVLPMAYPDQAASELERAVTELGLVGAMIDNHLDNGTFYDSEAFWSVFETAERLDVPLYIHPAPPSEGEMEHTYSGNYPLSVALRLAGSAYGWHELVAFHIVRLFAAGLFARYPRLKIILGHDGEFLPMMIDRVDDNRLRNDSTMKKVWKSNVWITVAGFFHLRNFAQLLEVTSPERIMYSVDYPFINTTDGWEFVKDLAGSGLMTASEMDMFAYKTAEGLLRLPRH